MKGIEPNNKCNVVFPSSVLPSPRYGNPPSPEGEGLTGHVHDVIQGRQSRNPPRKKRHAAYPHRPICPRRPPAVHRCHSGASVEKSPTEETKSLLLDPNPPRLRRALATKKTESAKLSVFYSIFGYFSVRYSVFSISTTVSSTIVSASSSSSDTISLPASGSNSTPLRFASNFLKSFEKKNPIAIITANTII